MTDYSQRIRLYRGKGRGGNTTVVYKPEGYNTRVVNNNIRQ